MNVQRCRSSWEKFPVGGVPSILGRRGSLVVWGKGARSYTMANGHRVLPTAPVKCKAATRECPKHLPRIA